MDRLNINQLTKPGKDQMKTMTIATRATIGLILATLLTSCAGMQPQIKRNVAFSDEMFATSLTNGTSTVTGQAFLKTRSGEVKFGAGNEVVCVPVNEYTDETQRAIISGKNLEAPDPRYFKYRRTTIADGNGNFEFRDIPGGEYYISCVIQWEYVTQYGAMPTGGVATARVKIADGESVKIILTK